MKIVFVDPKGVWEGLNNGIAYIASNMSDEHEIKVVDFVNRSGNTAKRLDVVKDADIIGISVKSFTLDESIMVANMVKKINPSAKIVAGGPHVMVDGLNLLKGNPIFDLGVFGEAETTFKEILSGKDPADISGVIHRVNGTVIQNPPREWNTDLDKLRFPAYDNFDSFESKIENWPLVTSRGCPYSCTYCFASGTLVHTNKGMIKIEELHNYNDVRVLSHSGK